MSEATARVKRLAASDKLKVVANLVKRNVATVTKPTTIALEDNKGAYTLLYIRTNIIG